MAKTDKSIEQEIPIEEAPPVIQELVAAQAEEAPAQAEETPEERAKRLQREDYERRAIEAAIEREDIFRRNGLLKPDESLTMDIEAAIAQRCCI
jgi:hypothetical protein